MVENEANSEKGTTGAATPSPNQLLMQMVPQMWALQAVATAARLGIADALAESQPQGSATLAQVVGADATALARLLRALASMGVLSEPSPRQYALTSLGELLRSDVSGSMRDWIIAETDTPHWQGWGSLYEGVRSGQTVVPQLYGMHIYDYYAAHPDQLASFSRALGNVSAMSAQVTLESYDFSYARYIVDVGGAAGDLLMSILETNVDARGVVFDRTQVVEATHKAIHARGLQERCEAVAGDFFEAVPPGGDLYILKSVIVDWMDAEALRILQNCRTVISSDGKLLLIETTIPDDNSPSMAQLVDLNMLVMTGGLVRHQGEYRALLADAGFRLTRIIPTGSRFDVMEAVVA